MTRTAIVVVLDSLRYDIWHKYLQNTDGILSKLDAGGTQFKYATATAPWSLPSHASMFTGLDPDEHGALSVNDSIHGVTNQLPRGLPDSTVSGCFTANPFVTTEYGFDGWDEHRKYWNPHPMSDVPSPEEDGWQKYVKAIPEVIFSDSPRKSAINGLARASERIKWQYDDGGAHLISDSVEWLDKQENDEDVFLFLNLMETHDPHRWLTSRSKRIWNLLKHKELNECNDMFTHGVYEGTYTLEDLDPGLIRRLLHNELKYIDQQLERLYNMLDRTKRLENALVLVCSDHGDGFGEEGFVYHVSGLTEPIIRTPLLIHAPDSTEEVISKRVSLSWIPSTIYTYFDQENDGPDLLCPRSYPAYVGARNTQRLQELITSNLPEMYIRDRRVVYPVNNPRIKYQRIDDNYSITAPEDKCVPEDAETVITDYEDSLESLETADRSSSDEIEDRLSDLGYL